MIVFYKRGTVQGVSIGVIILIFVLIGSFHSEDKNDLYCKQTYGSFSIGQSINTYPASENLYCTCQKGYELSPKTHQCVSPTQICKEEFSDTTLGQEGSFISKGAFDIDPVQEIKCIESSGNFQMFDIHGPFWFDKRKL